MMSIMHRMDVTMVAVAVVMVEGIRKALVPTTAVATNLGNLVKIMIF